MGVYVFLFIFLIVIFIVVFKVVKNRSEGEYVQQGEDPALKDRLNLGPIPPRSIPSRQVEEEYDIKLTISEEAGRSLVRNLSAFIGVQDEITVIVLDVETTGFNGSKDSVLSVAGIKCLFNTNTNDYRHIQSFERFYLPEAGYVPERASNVNHLTMDVLIQKRSGQNWPDYFKDDPAFYEFCRGTERFVGHNIEFDLRFLPGIKGRIFCTMKELTPLLRIPYNSRFGMDTDARPGRYKYPKLSEAIKALTLDYDESKLHSALYDTELTSNLFEVIVTKFYPKVQELLEKVDTWADYEFDEDFEEEERV